MPQQTFSQRMRLCALRGRMTRADLTLWFRRPYHTVSHWYNGSTPWGPNGEEAMRKLEILEAAINDEDHFPIPHQLSPKQRIAHMEAAIRDLHPRLPKTRAASAK